MKGLTEDSKFKGVAWSLNHHAEGQRDDQLLNTSTKLGGEIRSHQGISSMTYLRAFKNQIGVTMVQASKREPGGHCGCGFRHIPISLRT